MVKKKTRLDFMKMKKEGEQVAWVTAYDFSTASFVEQADMDMILVGDSLEMAVLGYQGTIPVTMADCISHFEDMYPFLDRAEFKKNMIIKPIKEDKGV